MQNKAYDAIKQKKMSFEHIAYHISVFKWWIK